MLISQRVTEAGNLENSERGYLFTKGLPFEYRRHAIAKTGADPDRQKSFDFYQLQRAVESKITATENAERMTILPYGNTQEMQLVQELRQQGDKLNRKREGRLLDPVGPIVHGGVLMQQQQSPPTVDREMEEMVSQLRSLKLSKAELAVAAQSMPFLDRIRMDPRKYVMLLNQASVQLQPPQDRTAFRRPQQVLQQVPQQVQQQALQQTLQQTPQQVKNMRLGNVRPRDYTQVRSRPTDKITEARKDRITGFNSYWARMQGCAI